MIPRVALASVVMVMLSACGGDVATTTTTRAATTTTAAAAVTTTAATTTTSTGATLPASNDPLPPTDFDTLAALFDPIVEPMGYRLGRAALIDRTTYEETPEGTHLAVYLTPLEDKSPDQFAKDFMPLAMAFVPAVFDTWDGLVSFDVCQEPFAWEGTTAPPGLTIFDIDRDSATLFDWSTVDLATLLAADRDLDGMSIHAQREIRESPTWRAALQG